MGRIPPPGTLTSPDGRALLVDYAGVLTPTVSEGWERFEESEGIPASTLLELLWEAYREGEDDNPVARIERGELDVADFERLLASRLRSAGHQIAAEGLVDRLFAELTPAGGVWDLVRDVRRCGIPAVLVSNSWGTGRYPGAQLGATFDEIVLSGRIGMRKPNRDIFEHAAGLVDAVLQRCVLIDDAPSTIRAARRYGMVGVHHRGDDEATRDAVLEGLGLS